MKKIVFLCSCLYSGLMFSQGTVTIINPSPLNNASGGALYTDLRDYKAVDPEVYRQVAFDSNFRRTYSDKELESIEGSPYIYKEFVKATILGVPAKVEVRYNTIQDVIDIKMPDGVYVLNKDEKFGTIQIENTGLKIKLVNYSLNNQPKYGYLFEVYQKNNISLYEKKVVVFKEAFEARNPYDFPKPARFITQKPIMFISTAEGKIIEMPKNKKELIKILPDKENEINNYDKTNQINLKNTENVIELLKSI